jgi:hypothetical protein
MDYQMIIKLHEISNTIIMQVKEYIFNIFYF